MQLTNKVGVSNAKAATSVARVAVPVVARQVRRSSVVVKAAAAATAPVIADNATVDKCVNAVRFLAIGTFFGCVPPPPEGEGEQEGALRPSPRRTDAIADDTARRGAGRCAYSTLARRIGRGAPRGRAREGGAWEGEGGEELFDSSRGETLLLLLFSSRPLCAPAPCALHADPGIAIAEAAQTRGLPDRARRSFAEERAAESPPEARTGAFRSPPPLPPQRPKPQTTDALHPPPPESRRRWRQQGQVRPPGPPHGLVSRKRACFGAAFPPPPPLPPPPPPPMAPLTAPSLPSGPNQKTQKLTARPCRTSCSTRS